LLSKPFSSDLRVCGRKYVGFSIPGFGTDFLVSLDGYPTSFCSGLSFIGGKTYAENESTVRRQIFARASDNRCG
jgi:hypothetical protein